MANFITFDSGLRLCFKRNKTSRSLAIGIFVGAGSRNEEARNNGIAHFIEHMLFKGTTTRSAFDIANEVDNMGANINAYTSRTVTAYYITAMADFFRPCMDILSDIYFNSTFTEENLEKERGVVLEEIHMYDDDGESLCADNLCLAYHGKKHSLARPILGTEKTVKSFTRDTIIDFKSRFYLPQNTCISIVGNITLEEAKRLVNEFFESKMSKERGYVAPAFRRIKPKSVFVSLDKPFEQSSVAIRMPAYCLNHSRDYAPILVGYLLGGAMSSRLFQKVREELGLVYEISAWTTHFYNDGYFDISFATNPTLVEKALLAVRDIVLAVMKDGFTETEFKKAKIQYETGLVISDESSFDSMRLMGKNYVIINKPMTVQKCIKDIEKLTMGDLNDAIRTIFNFDKTGVSYVGQPLHSDLLALYKTGERKEL